MFWNAGGFGYAIVLISLGPKKLVWLVCDHEYQTSYWSGKEQKTYFFIQSWFCPLFGEKVNFLTAPARSCCCCGQFDIGVSFCVWWLATPLNLSAKEFQIFSPCWTTLPIWQISNTFDLQRWRWRTVTKVANERYLPYLQLCRKAFFVNFMYWRCKSGPKLG